MLVTAYAEKFEDMAAYSRQAAYAPYESLKKVQEERDQYRSGQRDQGRPGSQFRPRSQAFKGKQVQHARSNQPPQCQREGRMSRECPQNKNQMQGRGTGRVYTLDARKAKSNNALIAGTCLINNHPCFILFDCGATHSFISIRCMKRLSLQAIPLSPPTVVTTAMDDVVDVVLGMDWLSANSVFTGCEEKLFIIPSSEATPKDVLTTIFEGTIGMVNFLFENEKSTLLVLTKESSDNLSVTQIPVVCEFPEVFPEDVASLPPEREVEFSIDLIPGTDPIFVSPYRMAPLELRELKNQLEGLLTKHFI
ncbi:uncharacterized protein LOC127101909 [Lathyrus oleraceus]|uniref:uncharacterized protein LOC127101909 n=1 Tax=Pisum sativum TaxID=3888 RepID=UPI0021D3EBE8|nr:uncharacterized protein LOC127101909 [Pisum sativum]